MKLSRKQLAVIAGILVVGVVAGRYIIAERKGAGGARSVMIPVSAMQVAARDVPLYLSSIGTVQAYNTVTVRARVDGELTAVAFREGQDVKKGDVLAQIDARSYRAALDSALANLAKDKTALENAQHDLTRYQETAAKGYTSAQKLDTQTAAVNTLTATLQADAANVENARIQLSYTTITAPIDGRTGIRLVDQGNIVRANDANGLVVITQVQPIAAIFTLPQDSLPAVNTAQAQGKLSVTAFSRDGETEFDHGTLELIDNQIDPATGTVRLKVAFPNEQRTLWPGQFINARLHVGTSHNGVALPARVIQRGAQGAYAYVVKEDQTVEARVLEVAQESRGEILVTKGLKAGEWVVVDGQLKLQPGTKVKIDIVGDAAVTGETRLEGTPAPPAEGHK